MTTTNYIHPDLVSTPQIAELTKEQIEYDEEVAKLFWSLDRKNRRKVLKKAAKWKAHVYKVFFNKNNGDQSEAGG